MGSDSFFSDFSGNVLNLSDVLMNSLGVSAMNYFNNVETAMNKYGTSIAGFGGTVTTTVSDISSKSKTAATDMKNMAEEMKNAFIEIADYVSDWQEKYSKAIDDMITKISTLIV
jgi:phage-related protein